VELGQGKESRLGAGKDPEEDKQDGKKDQL